MALPESALGLTQNLSQTKYKRNKNNEVADIFFRDEPDNSLKCYPKSKDVSRANVDADKSSFQGSWEIEHTAAVPLFNAKTLANWVQDKSGWGGRWRSVVSCR